MRKNLLADSNVIGMINSKGGMSFKNDPPLDVNTIPQINIYAKFFTDNQQYITNNPSLYASYNEGVKSCYRNNIDFSEFMLTITEISGDDYNDVLSEIIYTLSIHDCLKDIVCTPIELVSASISVGLYTVEDIDDSINKFNSKYLLPFDLDKNLKYLLVSIKKSEDKVCRDNSFETITIVDEEENEFYETFIRIADRSGRWSDWLEYDSDLEICINTFSLYLEVEKIIKDFRFIDYISYNVSIDGNYFTTYTYDQNRITNENTDISRYVNNDHSPIYVHHAFGPDVDMIKPTYDGLLEHI